MTRWRVGRLAVVVALALCAGTAAVAHAGDLDRTSADPAPRLVDGVRSIVQAPLGHVPLVRELGSDGNTGPSGRLAARLLRPRATRVERAAPSPAASRAEAAAIASLEFSARLSLLRAGLTGWRSTAPPPSSI